MRRTAVDSTNIASIGYKKTEKVLEVRFKSGIVYQYKDVPLDIYEDFQSAESKGSFFFKRVRNGGYSYTKIEK